MGLKKDNNEKEKSERIIPNKNIWKIVNSGKEESGN